MGTGGGTGTQARMIGDDYRLQLPVVPEMGDWRERGACNGAPNYLFFPERGASSKQKDAALAFCRVCDVKAECLDWALTVNEAGIWGGTTGRQRRDMTLRPVCVSCVTVRVRVRGSYCAGCRPKERREHNRLSTAAYKARMREAS